MNKIVKLLKNPKLLFLFLGDRGLFNWMDDKKYLKIAYKIKTKKPLNLENPETFNEKLQWLKIYDRQEKYIQMVDKYEAKQYVSSIIGSDFIIPTIGIWDSFDDINFEEIPKQFVLKCTHDSGGIIICKDKDKFNKNKARKLFKKSFKYNYYYGGREWPYKNVRPRIIAEKYMIDESTKELRDYKFFCFNGKMEFFKIDFDRFIEHRANYYDKEKKLMPVGEVVCPPKPEAEIVFPKTLDTMIKMAEKLSEKIPFVRVDFYNANEKIYFGEMTFFPADGFGKWTDEKYDKIFGNLIHLWKNN